MTSKRALRRKKCGTKRAYPTDAAARSAIYQVVRAGKVTPGSLSAYRCPFCHRYHFGHGAGAGPRS